MESTARSPPHEPAAAEQPLSSSASGAPGSKLGRVVAAPTEPEKATPATAQLQQPQQPAVSEAAQEKGVETDKESGTAEAPSDYKAEDQGQSHSLGDAEKLKASGSAAEQSTELTAGTLQQQQQLSAGAQAEPEEQSQASLAEQLAGKVSKLQIAEQGPATGSSGHDSHNQGQLQQHQPLPTPEAALSTLQAAAAEIVRVSTPFASPAAQRSDDDEHAGAAAEPETPDLASQGGPPAAEGAPKVATSAPAAATPAPSIGLALPFAASIGSALSDTQSMQMPKVPSVAVAGQLLTATAVEEAASGQVHRSSGASSGSGKSGTSSATLGSGTSRADPSAEGSGAAAPEQAAVDASQTGKPAD